MEFPCVFVFALVAFVCIVDAVSAKKAAKTEGVEPAPERSQVIRLRKGRAHRLKEIGDKFGTTQGQLVDWAVDALLEAIDANGGKLTLPFKLSSVRPEFPEHTRLNDAPAIPRGSVIPQGTERR